MAALESVVERLQATGVVGELWINGSFLTEKENPADVDIVLRVQGPLYDTATPAQRLALDWVAANLHDSHDCDSYVLVEWPPGHPSYWLGEYWYAYWLRQWGFSRAGVLKGIAVLQLGRGVL